jgi:hypothetical protein
MKPAILSLLHALLSLGFTSCDSSKAMPADAIDLKVTGMT